MIRLFRENVEFSMLAPKTKVKNRFPNNFITSNVKTATHGPFLGLFIDRVSKIGTSILQRKGRVSA